MQTNIEKINILAHKIYEKTVAVRHLIHQNPELSYEEKYTSNLVYDTLSEFGITSQKIPDSTAIVATIEGKTGKNCIAIRADMDALPIQEKTNLPFASQVPNVMHACGHDLHTANLLGVAYILKQMQECFNGTIKLLFQPAEEMGGGAAEMIDFGVLENPKVEAILAAHVTENLPVGQIMLKAEEVMLASIGFTVEFTGKGGHGAAPHKAEDTIIAAAGYIMDLQSIPGKAQNFLDPAVISVGTINGGERPNIISAKTTISGSIRAQRKHVLPKIMGKMQILLKAREITTNTQGTIEFKEATNAVYNDPELTEVFKQAAAKILGEDNVIISKLPANGSENFALFSDIVPSVFFHFGVKYDNGKKFAPAHSSYFIAADESLLPAMKVLSYGALKFLQHDES